MHPRRTATLFVATSIASMIAFAQTPPPSDTTSPSAASSPHQRDATSTQAAEAPPANGANPAAASTPHQQRMASTDSTTQAGKAAHKQAMKDCVTKQQSEHSGVSMAAAKKTCKEQLKANSGK